MRKREVTAPRDTGGCDSVAQPTSTGLVAKTALADRTPAIRAAAMSYAAHAALVDQYPAQKAAFDAYLGTLGYDPVSPGASTPAALGISLTQSELAYCHTDGANQLGDMAAGGAAYADYTGYVPRNPPMIVSAPTPLSLIPAPGNWQPLSFTDAAGKVVTPGGGASGGCARVCQGARHVARPSVKPGYYQAARSLSLQTPPNMERHMTTPDPHPVKIPGPDHPITITPISGVVTVTVDGKTIASSAHALTLQEANYPPVQYLRRDDIDMTQFTRTDHTTYCPYKGVCVYFSVPSGGVKSVNAIWSYEEPHDAVAAIKNFLAFYPDRVDAIAIA
jgi:uncharacterized protein (DUF427 family)